VTLTTGVGSLPFTRLDEALKHVFASYTLPFYPQLPQRADASDARLPLMLREVVTPTMLEALKKRDGHGFVRALESAEADEAVSALYGWDDFAVRAAGAPMLKVQCAGPVAFWQMTSKLVADVPDAVLRPLAARWIGAYSTALARRASALCETLYFVWDDGGFATHADGDARKAAEQLVTTKLPRARFGFHSCEPGTLERWTSTMPRAVLALDLSVVGVVDTQEQRVMAAKHLQRGGDFIFGVVDTSSTKIQPERGMELARAARALGARPILSGGCGTGLHQPAYELALAQSLQAAAALLNVGS